MLKKTVVFVNNSIWYFTSSQQFVDSLYISNNCVNNEKIMKFERMKFFVNMILFIVIAYVQEIYETYLDAEQKGHLEKELEELKKK